MARARSEEHGCGRGVACPRAFLPGDEQARWPAPRSGVATPALRGGCQAASLLQLEEGAGGVVVVGRREAGLECLDESGPRSKLAIVGHPLEPREGIRKKVGMGGVAAEDEKEDGGRRSIRASNFWAIVWTVSPREAWRSVSLRMAASRLLEELAVEGGSDMVTRAPNDRNKLVMDFEDQSLLEKKERN
ncbi:hypothetical protein GYH30_051820 [Glycine max]|nr:hypothetical protein GYH30_051820 [Glycine max]